jgi:hypothetical protein
MCTCESEAPAKGPKQMRALAYNNPFVKKQIITSPTKVNAEIARWRPLVPTGNGTL